jgi:hypothetical protein
VLVVVVQNERECPRRITTVANISQGHNEKALRYIALLDDARANARWTEVPELIRKVTKHAPQRKCESLPVLACETSNKFQA